MTDRQDTALAMLASLGTGALDRALFATDAHWWWNGGLDLPVAAFDDLLGQLHVQTSDGIRIVPGRVIVDGDSVMVEATTRSPMRDGRLYDNRYIFLIHFAGDRIAEVREYSDSAHVLATFDLTAAA